MRVVSYTPEWKSRWDEFVASSTNATFLHLRDYMEYHADRFTDASRLVIDSNNRIVALFPANAEGTTVCSHRGLTYGGLLVGPRHFDTSALLEAWQAITANLRANGFDTLIYKPVPAIYCSYPSDDDIYALFRSGATLTGCMTASVVPLSQPLLLNQCERRQLAKAQKLDITVNEATDFAPYWTLLQEVLAERHDATPVHTLDEITRLKALFPENIRLFTASSPEGELLGGILVYYTGRVAHSQYIAISPEGRQQGAFAAIFSHIVENHCREVSYFDFGTSCLDGGKILNAPLNTHKYHMGGRSAAYTTWTVKL